MNAVSPPEAGYAEETQIKSIFGILIVVALIAEHLHEDLHEDRYRLCGRSHGTASLPCEAPNMQRGSLAGAPLPGRTWTRMRPVDGRIRKPVPRERTARASYRFPSMFLMPIQLITAPAPSVIPAPQY